MRIVPGGMMSTSSVSSGRCCAPAINQPPAKHVNINSARDTTLLLNFIGDDCNDSTLEGQRTKPSGVPG
jgi:hypothetical protein